MKERMSEGEMSEGGNGRMGEWGNGWIRWV